MATISISSPATARLRSSLPLTYSQNTPKPTFNPFPKSPLLFPCVTLQPSNRAKPRLLNVVVSAAKKLSEADLVTVPSENDAIVALFPKDKGVYAVYDANEELQFVGISRNLAASLLQHKRNLPELCSSVKFAIVDDPDRAALTLTWKSWMEEHIIAAGKLPPGNEKGNSTWFPPQPQPKRKPDVKLTPGRHVQLTVPLENLIDRLVKESKVVAFIKGSRTAPQCGFSQRVVAILDSQGVDYESVDVLDEEHNYGLRETLKTYSSWPTFPQIFVNGELLGGCDILTSIYQKGELSSVLNNPN